MQQSSVIRHSRNHTYSDSNSQFAGALTTRGRGEELSMPDADAARSALSTGATNSSMSPSTNQQLVTTYVSYLQEGVTTKQDQNAGRQISRSLHTTLLDMQIVICVSFSRAAELSRATHLSVPRIQDFHSRMQVK
jgi:hypothetical protein